MRLYPPRPDDSVLEIAAGTGALTTLLAKHADSVLATDLSPQMVQHIARDANDLGLSNVRPAVADIASLAFPEESFDSVYCMFGIMFFPEPQKNLRDLMRVLRPGGRCVITSWNTRSQLLAPVAAAMTKLMPQSPQARALNELPPYGDCGVFAEKLQQAGFEDVVCTEVEHGLEIPSVEVYIRVFPGTNPDGIAMQRMPQPLIDSMGVAIEGELKNRFGDGPIVLAGVANIASGRKP
ncbi:MAG: class I SAM-dependent methyltransferase [Candidatus Eremiobacteraeota bacterium]|nr:class I SAM-dependent methyltransferase [Candidatus Eremiobacteraeota bacterium]